MAFARIEPRVNQAFLLVGEFAIVQPFLAVEFRQWEQTGGLADSTPGYGISTLQVERRGRIATEPASSTSARRRGLGGVGGSVKMRPLLTELADWPRPCLRDEIRVRP